MGKDNIVSIDKLEGAENYSVWRFQMTQILESRDLEKCIEFHVNAAILTTTAS